MPYTVIAHVARFPDEYRAAGGMPGWTPRSSRPRAWTAFSTGSLVVPERSRSIASTSPPLGPGPSVPGNAHRRRGRHPDDLGAQYASGFRKQAAARQIRRRLDRGKQPGWHAWDSRARSQHSEWPPRYRSARSEKSPISGGAGASRIQLQTDGPRPETNPSKRKAEPPGR